MKIYEYRGVRGLVAAEVLSDTDEGFVTDTPFPVAGVAEISKSTDSTNTAKYYDNQASLTVSSTGADELTINTSAIPFDVLAKITGQFYDETLGMYVETERTPKNFALGYCTQTTSGEEVFVWRLKGTFNIPNEDNKTQDDSTDSAGQELTYTGIATTFAFNKTHRGAKSVYVNTAVNPQDEDEFFATVQTPDTVQSSGQTAELTGLTIASCTLSPAFDTATTTYTTTTSNASNKVTAVVSNGGTAEIKVNGTAIENGSNASWTTGSNTLTVKVGSTTYTVTVTKE